MNNEQIVEKLDKAKFRIYWKGVSDSEILMDFNPVINIFNLTGLFTLTHWQAKPIGLRRWGIYDSYSDSYYGFDYDKFFDQSRCSPKPLQIDESIYKIKPTAVYLYKDTFVISSETPYQIVIRSYIPNKRKNDPSL